VTTGLRLRALVPEDEAPARAAHAAGAAEGFTFLYHHEPGEDWAAYLARLDDERHGRVPPGVLPGTFLVATVDDDIVGRVSIRHALDEFHRIYGGHIGYSVLPPFRRRGHATEILRQALAVARGLGLERVLVTCDEDNVASARVIERNGGVFESLVDRPGHPRKRRYWFG
jgi:predicted acetyltransferase